MIKNSDSGFPSPVGRHETVYSGVRPCIVGPGVLFKTDDMENTAIKELFDNLYLSGKQLTSSQMQFIEGCKKQFRRNKTLSEKQLTALREIRKFIPGDQVRFSGSVADNWKH